MKTTVPVFYPSIEEFADFEKYVEKIESFSNGYGMVKVVPPSGWVARKKGYNSINPVVSHPIKQIVTGLAGKYQVILVSQNPMNYRDFKQYAQRRELKEKVPIEEVERMFWKHIRFDSPIYGADSDTTSLFDKNTPWNLSNLPSVLEDGLKPNKLRGINTSFLYFGSWKSMFCWHKEDLDLYSINYLHFGRPKIWYCIPLEEGEKFERFCRFNFNSQFEQCQEFLRHKSVQVSPTILKSAGIKFDTAIHNPGEFIIIFSGCYHMGFNSGFNCAEAVNFALNKWVDIGANAKRCCCDGDTVQIDMDEFKKNLESNRSGMKIEKKRKID